MKSSLNDDVTKDWLIKSNYHDELDRLRTLVDQGSQALLTLEQQEQKTTGINSLKIRFNSTHGYAFEITKSNFHLIPPHYRRVQTLKDRERFTTQELKDLEYDIKRAQADSGTIEKELFDTLCQQVYTYIPLLKKTATLLAEIDAYNGYAHAAHYFNYTKPSFTHTRDIIIEQGRHPVIENRMRSEGNECFIANSLTLTDQESLWIITGPNMGGKSTFLRQNALINIMAQAGSFVPAKQAELPLLDRIFTRIGAADNVARGKSTFWVEMEETALICNQATEKSLVILDEVGRGTSTYDGLAIAQAVLEYIYTTIKARCLFATHYYELTSLAQHHPSIATYHTANTKGIDGIVLLHQIKPGRALGSFGIDVARNAQIPLSVINRAQEILSTLPTHATEQLNALQSMQKKPSLHEEKYMRVTNSIKSIDCDNLSPRQAFDLIYELKKMCSGTEHR